MTTASWFQTGDDGVKMSDQKEKEQKLRYEKRVPFKFKVPEGGSRKATVLDDPFFFLSLHSIKNTRGGFDDITCINDFDTCPICASGLYPSHALLVTIINHEHEGKDGKKYPHAKQLAMFKSGAKTKFLRTKKELNDKSNIKSLVGCAFTFNRDKKKECSTGEDARFIRQFTPAQMLKMAPKSILDKGKAEVLKYLQPYDYEKIFAPRTKEELSALIGAPAPVGEQDNSAGANSIFNEPVKNADNGNKAAKEEDVDDGDIDDLLNG